MAQDVSEDLGIKRPEKMTVVYTPGDILAFLAQMPSESPNVVLVLNGIDTFVIPKRLSGRDPRSPSYHQMVADEILRVLPRGGAVMTWGSEDVTEHFTDENFEVAPGYSKEKGAMFSGQVWVKK